MAKYSHADFLDGGYTYFKANVNQMVLLKAYAAGDTYATTTGNIVATVAMVTGDFTLSGADIASRLMTSAVKTAAASVGSGATPNLHIAFRDTVTSKVLWVTDETSDQVITSGNNVNFPALVYTAPQPA